MIKMIWNLYHTLFIFLMNSPFSRQKLKLQNEITFSKNALFKLESNDEWFSARVVQLKEDFVRMHYLGYSSAFDEVIEIVHEGC